jgi:hypothetical protein
VKSKTRNLALGCLVALGLLFAVSTPAQRATKDAPASSNSQEKLKSDAANPDVTSACTYKFTSGTGTTYLQFCVSANGNIVEFESPSDVEQINQGGIAEGYGLCDQTTLIGYDDYAYTASSNWNPATKVSSTATSVKIERTTSDGAWTLTQTITLSAGTNPYAKIVMALKNNSGETKGVTLFRFVDSDPGNAAQTDTSFAENGDGTYDSAFSYLSSTSSGPPYGLMLQAVGNPTPASAASAFREGFAESTSIGPPPCDSQEFQTQPVTGDDDALIYEWSFNITKNQTVTVTSRYISF